MRSFWGKFNVKPSQYDLQSSKLDGDGYFTHVRLEIPFSANLVQKINGIYPNSNMLVSLVMLTIPFWGIFGLKILNNLFEMKFCT